MSRRFVVITCVRETPWHLDRCLQTIADQQYDNFTCVVVDDASEDETPHVVSDWCGKMGWPSILRLERVGAVRNQVDAIRLSGHNPDDVLVFVDGDDRLARTDTFDILNRVYDAGALVSFGQYEPDPPSATCSPAIPYRRSVIRQNAYRRCSAPHSWNHLRTFARSIFDQMDESDFRDDKGRWFENTPDSVFMFPALELARGAVTFVPETLILYTSDLPSAEWRDHPERVNFVNRTVLARPPKC